MKNLLKKFGVMMACAMLAVTTFAMPAAPSFAADGFTVSNVQEGATVTAYKIINQKANGSFDRAQDLTSSDIKELEAPTTKEITDLAIEAQKATGSKLKASASAEANDEGKAVFTGLTAGTYLVLITNAVGNTKVYNPLLISVDKDGTVNTDASVGSKPYDKINGAVAKVSDVTFNKEIARGNDANAGSNSNVENDKTTNDGEKPDNYGGTAKDSDKYADSGDTAGKGDVVWFKITSAIPTYADNYKDVKFNIHDTLSTGLKLGAKDKTTGEYDYSGIKVIVGNDEIAAKDGDKVNYTLTRKANDAGFDLVFDEAFIKSHGNASVEVRYPATVQDNCRENFDAEKNTASLEYTNAPGQEHNGEKITTYHYTFTINGQINGPDSGENREAVKVGIDEDTGKWVIQETTWKENKGWKPLEGAKFGLYTKDQLEGDPLKVKSGQSPIREAVSRADGMLMDENDPDKASLDRLDAGEYYLVEMEAPDGFAENKTAVPVKIEATIGQQGVLTAYKITIGTVVAGDYTVKESDYTYDKDTDTYTIATNKITRNDLIPNIQHYKKQTDAEGNVTYVVDPENTDSFDEAADLANSKIGTLPSTGGMGTILFTVGGIVIIALALFVLLGGRRKQRQN